MIIRADKQGKADTSQVENDLAKKPETKPEWQKLIAAAEDLLKTAGAV